MAATISAEISLDELRKFVPKFVNSTRKQLAQELIRQARLLVRDSGDNGLLSITPPKDEAQGAGAVSRDINRVFVTATTVRSILANSGQRGARPAFNRYVRAGGPDYSEARALDFLNSQTPSVVEVRPYTTKKGKRVGSYTQTRQIPTMGDPRLGNLQFVGNEPSRALHKQARNSQGRVNQARWSQLVMSKGKMTSYIAKSIKRVGLMKAGWGKAWDSMGLVNAGRITLPEFVSNNLSKASGRGRANVSFSDTMFIEMANTTPMSSTKIRQGRVDWLLAFRQKQIARELENRMGKLATAA